MISIDKGSQEYQEILELQAIIRELVDELEKKDRDIIDIAKHYEAKEIKRLGIWDYMK